MKLRRASVVDERVATALHSGMVHLLRRVAQEDDDRVVGPAALSALSVLVFGGDRRLSDLAGAERVSLPTMTRVVDGLERAGFARRRRDEIDRRQVWVVATAAGRRHLLAGRDRRVGFLAARLRRLDVAEREVLEQAAVLLAVLAHDEPR